MNEAALIAAWQEEEQKPFAGWDFSYLRGRKHEEAPPQDYPQRVFELMSEAQSVLDLDTGGGERLLGFRHEDFAFYLFPFTFAILFLVLSAIGYRLSS